MPEVNFTEVVEDLTKQIEIIVHSETKWWEKVGTIAELITPRIEDAAKGWAGADKKKIALQMIDMIWFKYFNIKYIPDFFEKPLVDYLASKAIDAAVAQFNKLGVFKHSTP